MQIIIAKSTILALNTQARDELHGVEGMPEDFVASDEQVYAGIAAAVAESARYKNFELVDHGEVVRLVVNDEALHKAVALYISVARFIVPLIKPVAKMLGAFRADAQDVEDFILEKK